MNRPTRCPFCAILGGEAPASLVCEDAHAVAFMDLRQAVPGHVLVVPRRHVETIFELDGDTAAALMRMAVRVAQAAERAFAPAGLNLWQSNREAGGQEVPHLHLHVQPRRVGDGLLRVYPGAVPAPAARRDLDGLAVELRARLD
ncbi:MAG TPA: HIT family protein [Pseudoxanthomonas sp.]|nr:HIT family protein [Pseudoxanthomonas sp.]